jgi:hypothetical protein
VRDSGRAFPHQRGRRRVVPASQQYVWRNRVAGDACLIDADPEQVGGLYEEAAHLFNHFSAPSPWGRHGQDQQGVAPQVPRSGAHPDQSSGGALPTTCSLTRRGQHTLASPLHVLVLGGDPPGPCVIRPGSATRATGGGARSVRVRIADRPAGPGRPCVVRGPNDRAAGCNAVRP